MADIGTSQSKPDYEPLAETSAGGMGGGLAPELFGQILNAVGIPTMAMRAHRQNAAYQMVQRDMALGIEPSKDAVALLPDDFQKIVKESMKGEQFARSRQEREIAQRKADALEELTAGMNPERFKAISSLFNMTPTPERTQAVVPELSGLNANTGQRNTPTEQLVWQAAMPASVLAAAGRTPTEVQAASQQQATGAENIQAGMQFEAGERQRKSQEGIAAANRRVEMKGIKAQEAATAQRAAGDKMALASQLFSSLGPWAQNLGEVGAVVNEIQKAVKADGSIDVSALAKITTLKPAGGGGMPGDLNNKDLAMLKSNDEFLKGYHQKLAPILGDKDRQKRGSEIYISVNSLNAQWVDAYVNKMRYEANRIPGIEEVMGVADTTLVVPQTAEGWMSGKITRVDGAVTLGQLRTAEPQRYESVRNQLQKQYLASVNGLGGQGFSPGAQKFLDTMYGTEPGEGQGKGQGQQKTAADTVMEQWEMGSGQAPTGGRQSLSVRPTQVPRGTPGPTRKTPVAAITPRPTR